VRCRLRREAGRSSLARLAPPSVDYLALVSPHFPTCTLGRRPPSDDRLTQRLLQLLMSSASLKSIAFAFLYPCTPWRRRMVPTPAMISVNCWETLFKLVSRLWPGIRSASSMYTKLAPEKAMT